MTPGVKPISLPSMRTSAPSTLARTISVPDGGGSWRSLKETLAVSSAGTSTASCWAAWPGALT